VVRVEKMKGHEREKVLFYMIVMTGVVKMGLGFFCVGENVSLFSSFFSGFPRLSFFFFTPLLCEIP